MSLSASLRVPVELRRLADKERVRWFRLALEVHEDGLDLSSAVPEEADGPLELTFHLPGDPAAIRCRARAEERLVGSGEAERAERRGLTFLDLEPAGRIRIEAYLQEKLGAP